MPAAIAIPLALGAGTAAAGVIGSKIQAGSAEDAATKQQQSNADALNFQRQQAAQDLVNANTAGRANWEQWAAKQGRLSQLGQSVGLQPFQIPGYVPMQAAPPMPPAPAAPTNPNIMPMGQAFQTSLRSK